MAPPASSLAGPGQESAKLCLLVGYLVLSEKPFHAAGDFFPVRFECKMPGIQQMSLKVLKVAGIRSRAFRREYKIILAPHNQSRRLIGPEEILKLRVQRHIGAVVVE